MGNRIVATSYYHTTGDSHNLGPNENKDAIYHHCIMVFFDSVRQFHDFDLVLFTNQEIPDYKGVFARCGVRQVIVEDTPYIKDPRVTNQFPGCLFKFDALTYLSKMDFDSAYFFDNDCIFQKDIWDMVKVVETGRLAGIRIPYDIDTDINGHNIRFLASMSGLDPETFVHFGGEFCAFTKNDLAWVCQQLKVVWDFLLFTNHPRTYVDEHLLSIIFNLSDKGYLSETFIKRHWTSYLYDNTDGTEPGYNVLHLPAEKNGIFAKKYEQW